MWKRMIGTFWIHAVQEFFDDKSIQWHIKFNVLYINTDKQEIKAKAFKHKKELLEKINSKLADMGYQVQIKDIRFLNKMQNSD